MLVCQAVNLQQKAASVGPTSMISQVDEEGGQAKDRRDGEGGKLGSSPGMAGCHPMSRSRLRC